MALLLDESARRTLFARGTVPLWAGAARFRLRSLSSGGTKARLTINLAELQSDFRLSLLRPWTLPAQFIAKSSLKKGTDALI